MKVQLVFSAVIMAASAMCDAELWLKFREDYQRTYESWGDEKYRFDVFKRNLATIKEHNAKYDNGEETWYMGTNKFSDLSDEEFAEIYVSYITYDDFQLGFHQRRFFRDTAPDSFDWRTKNVVLSVKYQGYLAISWAFSALAAIEGQNAKKHGIRIDLSPQELLDCSDGPLKGSNVTRVELAFEYIKNNGISALEDYPYIHIPATCHEVKNSGNIKLTGFRKVTPDETHLKQAVASVGPISVGVDLIKVHHYNAKNYGGGIFNQPSCGNGSSYEGLVVGYGTEKTIDYWIVKTSFGVDWGEGGYIRMIRNKSNQCGIANSALYPVIA